MGQREYTCTATWSRGGITENKKWLAFLLSDLHISASLAPATPSAKMAADGIQQPLLLPGGGGDPADAIRQKPPDGVKRFRRCRTAPSSDLAAAASEEPRPPTPPGTASRTAPPKKVLESGRPSSSFRLVGLLLFAYVVAGTTAFYLFMDHMSGHHSGSRAIDALYFCVVTMTTVGYGDLVPSSDTGKLLASAFAFGGVAVVGTSLSKSADYLVEKQESLVFRAVHANGKHPARELRAMEMNKTWYKLYAAAALLAASVASGTLVLWKGEGMRPVDALYCVCATVTTLGYGDRSFRSTAGRAFAAVWVTVSTVVVALFFLYVAELYAERRQRALARWVLTRRTTNTDLEAADLDGDRRVGAAEFVLYKLKELGKISQEEISEFMEEFDELDADHNGTLSPSDLAVAQQATA